MGTFLMCELLAEDRAARYRAEAEHDRQLALLGALRRRTKQAAPASEPMAPALSGVKAAPVPAPAGPAATAGKRGGTRRALAAAAVGAVAMGILRRRRTIAPR
jgi:hypothetical protein